VADGSWAASVWLYRLFPNYYVATSNTAEPWISFVKVSRPLQIVLEDVLVLAILLIAQFDLRGHFQVA